MSHNDFLQPYGHPFAETASYDVPFSHWYLPPKPYVPSSDLDGYCSRRSWHPPVQTHCHDVPQSQWNLNKKTYSPDFDEDDYHSDTRSWCPKAPPNTRPPEKTPRDNSLFSGPILCPGTLAQLEQEDLDIAIYRSLCDEAERREKHRKEEEEEAAKKAADILLNGVAIALEEEAADIHLDDVALALLQCDEVKREEQGRKQGGDVAIALSKCAEAKQQRQQQREEAAADVLLNESEERSDFDTGQWLSDASIARVYSELAAGNLGNIEPQPLSEEILLMDPAVAFWLVHQDLENTELAATELKLQDKQLVLCPIHDDDGGCTNGGGHWTLLVAWRSGKEAIDNNSCGGYTFKNFTYYDSLCIENMCNRNHVNAEKLARILSGDSTYLLHRTSCAQQVNSYDCGVYVIAFSEIITSAFMDAQKESRSIENEDGNPSWADWIREVVSPSSVTDVRRYYFNAFAEAGNQVKEAEIQSGNHELQS